MTIEYICCSCQRIVDAKCDNSPYIQTIKVSQCDICKAGLDTIIDIVESPWENLENSNEENDLIHKLPCKVERITNIIWSSEEPSTIYFTYMGKEISTNLHLSSEEYELLCKLIEKRKNEIFKTNNKENNNKPLLKQENKIPVYKVPKEIIEQIALCIDYGDKKYKEGNWLRYTNINDLTGASDRHSLSIKDGEMVDKESGLHHSIHVITNQIMIYMGLIYGNLNEKDLYSKKVKGVKNEEN